MQPKVGALKEQLAAATASKAESALALEGARGEIEGQAKTIKGNDKIIAWLNKQPVALPLF